MRRPDPNAPDCDKCGGPCKRWRGPRYPEDTYQRLTVLIVIWSLVLIVCWIGLVVPAILTWGD